MVQSQHMRTPLPHLSVTEMILILRCLQEFREELKLVLFAGDDAIETLMITDEHLIFWNDQLDQSLAAEQEKITCNHLRIWDNEGGNTN